MERHKIQKIIFLIILSLLFFACAHSKPLPKEVVLNFQSEIPIKVTIQKSCEGNWNFCDIDNHNFKKWE